VVVAVIERFVSVEVTDRASILPRALILPFACLFQSSLNFLPLDHRSQGPVNNLTPYPPPSKLQP